MTTKSLGFRFNSDYVVSETEYGTFTWETEDTYWEYDPNTDMTRHCGKGTGCFWTEWN